MKLLSNLAKSSRVYLLALLAALPLVLALPLSAAAEERKVDFSQRELDQMLAPIALYPDALLSQILIASTYPLEIIQADRWVRSNSDLKTEDALKFAEKKDWDPSVKSLVAFPDLLKRMSEDVDWTQRLGDAFLSSEEEVMDTVQRLRKRAYATGNLEKAQHIRVENEDNNIVIEPAEERVVYVPVYDTRVVYGNWWWADYPPVYWNYPSHYTYVSGFYWGPSVFIGSSYFYSSCRWSNRQVVVIDRRTHYIDEPRFYTGRSIVRYDGAREWRHDPTHRRGVAYYNENLRATYGSQRESYQSDRDYRQRHQSNDNWHRDNNDNNRNNNDWRSNNRDHDRDNGRNDNGNRMVQQQNNLNLPANRANVDTRANNNAQPVDRAEELRARMNQRENSDHNNDNRMRVENRVNPSQNNLGTAPVQLIRENSPQDRANRPVQLNQVNAQDQTAPRGGNITVPANENRSERRVEEHRQETTNFTPPPPRVENRTESRGGGNSEQSSRERAWRAHQGDNKDNK